MNGQTTQESDYYTNNHDDVTTDDVCSCFESQTVDMNQLLFTRSLENSNDHSQPINHQNHSKIPQDEVHDHHHHHHNNNNHNHQQHEQLSHQPQSQQSLSSSSSTSSSTSSLSSPFSSSSQTIEQTSSIQNNNTNNNIPRTKLFVGRLPENCTSNLLEDLFSKYGQVTECDVVGRYGFVHMSKSEEAEECVKKLNRYSFMGSLLTVEFSTSKVHPEPGTLGRAKGVSRMTKGIRPRIHNHTPYHREPYINHRTSLGPPPPPPPHSVPLPPLRPHATTQIPPPPPPPLLPPGRIYGGYSSPYYQDSYRAYERDIFYETDYYGRERHYPPPHDHRPPPPPSGGGGSNYEFDSRTYSPPPPSSLAPPPPPPPPPHYPIYSNHHNMPIRAYERPVIDEPIPMYTSRGSSMTPHKCHYHKCHYDMHVKPYLN